MIDGAELVIAVEQLASDLPSYTESVRDRILKAVAGVILPLGIGSAVTGIVTETADRRWEERVVELLTLFAQRLVDLKEQIEKHEYYGSEEFQALFIEAVDQQRTNRYGFKRRMLAQGLAQSGTRQFSGERDKETFFKILRDLAPTDVQMLEQLSETTNRVHMGLYLKEQTLERVTRATSVDVRVYRLQGFGLVTTFQRLPAPNLSGPKRIEDQGSLNRFVADALGAEPHIHIQISDFGTRFLRFLKSRADAESH